MAVLHLGTFDFNALHEILPQAQRCLGVVGDPSVWRFGDGDDWEEWGEGRTEHQPEHVIIEGAAADLMQDVSYILTENPALLEPMTYPNQIGTLAVVTQVDEAGDANELYVVVDGTERDFIRRLTRDMDEAEVYHLWEQNAEWREHRNLPAVTS